MKLAARLFIGCLALASLCGAASAVHAEPAPGLILEFRTPEGRTLDARTGRLLSLFIPDHQPPSPFTPPGPFVAQWRGELTIPLRDLYTFTFHGTGTLRLTLAGHTILDARGDRPATCTSSPVLLHTGPSELLAVYTPPIHGDAQVRLTWSSADFAAEPLPPTLLSHNAGDPLLVRMQTLRRGRRLLAENRCVRCHTPDPDMTVAGAMPDLVRNAPMLVDAGLRLNTRWLARWIENPRSLRPDAKMPQLFHGPTAAQDARDVAAFLSTLRYGDAPSRAVPQDAATIRRGAALYAQFGCVACHRLKGQPAAGPARIPLSLVAAKFTPAALQDYLLHPARRYPGTPMPDFHLADGEATALAAFLISRSDDLPATQPAGDPSRGAKLVATVGCIACHAMPAGYQAHPEPLNRLRDWSAGCVANDAAHRGSAPDFSLSFADRAALRAFAAAGFDSLRRDHPAEVAERQIARLQCAACHTRDGSPDRWTSLKSQADALVPADHAAADHDGDPGIDQTRPDLTWVGQKLRAAFIRDQLAGTLPHRSRPWIAARMPSFADAAGSIADGLAMESGYSPADPPHPGPDPKLAAIGERLTHKHDGFGCTDCHGVGDQPPQGVFGAVGINFTDVANRLRHDYYVRWLNDPQRVDPHTAMPRYADARGRTQLADILGGDARGQFDAIWNYLQSIRFTGKQAAKLHPAFVNAVGHLRPLSQQGHWDGFQESSTRDDRWERMDTGRLFSGSLRGGAGTTVKAIAIQIGDHRQAAIAFDTDLLRYAEGWTGKFFTIDPLRLGLVGLPSIGGTPRFQTPVAPGVARDGNFDDPRPDHRGPLPHAWGHYRGLYVHGDRMVLRYTVGDTDVLDSPWIEEVDHAPIFTRTLNIAAGSAVALRIVDAPVAVALARPVAGASLVSEGGAVVLKIAPRSQPMKLKLLIGGAELRGKLAALATRIGSAEDLSRWTEAGPARWPQTPITRGIVSPDDGSYVIDTLTLPYENPYKSLMFLTGVDFLPDGRAVVTTVEGDVWIVSGIDAKLEHLTWKRFAAGLFQPLGVKCVGAQVYVLGRDQITRLHDDNGDGEADYYENFNNDGVVAPEGHTYATCLETDSHGNFYYLRGGGRATNPHGGALLRVSHDGSKLEVYATGFRNPNGLGIGPGDVITAAPQEGEWTPASNIAEVRRGGFYGYMPAAGPGQSAAVYDEPLVWIPRSVDNSTGGQVWAPAGDTRFGPLAGHLFSTSFGRCTWMMVLREVVGGVAQGSVVPLPGKFLAGVVRGRFRPQDGQLYLAGLNGWVTSAVRDGCLQRVRYTGHKVYLPTSLNALANGIRVRFTEPLDRATATDPDSYNVERWAYHRGAEYGSRDWSVINPDRPGHDPVKVAAVDLSSDGRTVLLRIDRPGPVMQMGIRYALIAADGHPVRGAIFTTIHKLGPAGLAE